VRRRPGAGGAASTPNVAVSTPEAQPTPTSTPDEANATSTPQLQAETQLLTPSATQEVTSQHVQQPEHVFSRPTTTLVETSAPSVEPTPILAPTPIDNTNALQVEKAADITQCRNSPYTVESPRPVEEELKPSPLSKQLQIEPDNEAEGTPDEQHVAPLDPAPVVQDAAIKESAPIEPQGVSAPLPERSSEDVAQTTAASAIDINEVIVEASRLTKEGESSDMHASRAQFPAEPTRPKRRRLPWTAVNAPRDDAEDYDPATTMVQPKAKRRRQALTLREIDEEEELEVDEEEESEARSKRPSTKARGKRKVREPATDDQATDAAQPAEKARKPRKDKGKKRAAAGVEENGDDEPAEAEPPRLRKKKRKNQSTEPAEGGNEGDEGEQQPRHRGRPPREATPSDAENEQIDESNTLMTSIASRNIRVGRLSEREKKMRTIDWKKVKQDRRLEEMTRSTSDIRAEADQRLEKDLEAANAASNPSGPRYQEIDGVFTLVAGTGVIDREGDADRERDAMVVVDEDDITKHINYRSFMRNNKRFPNEFLLPGQGKRWNFKDTEDFYEALAMCGTDFQRISTLFPGVTRRSVKKKFTREERENPQRIKETLQGQLNPDWDLYLARSGRKESDFVANPKEFWDQLNEEKRIADIEIDKAKAAAEEERRQRRLAGIDSGDEAAVDKENENGKGKKSKKATKQVTFELGEDEEVVGLVDD
jgi:transcription factor TFIIIB component B''